MVNKVVGLVKGLLFKRAPLQSPLYDDPGRAKRAGRPCSPLIKGHAGVTARLTVGSAIAPSGAGVREAR